MFTVSREKGQLPELSSWSVREKSKRNDKISNVSALYMAKSSTL